MSGSEERLQQSIQDLFEDGEDDDIYEPATELSTLASGSQLEDETETDDFEGHSKHFSMSVHRADIW